MHGRKSFPADVGTAILLSGPFYLDVGTVNCTHHSWETCCFLKFGSMFSLLNLGSRPRDDSLCKEKKQKQFMICWKYFCCYFVYLPLNSISAQQQKNQLKTNQDLTLLRHKCMADLHNNTAQHTLVDLESVAHAPVAVGVGQHPDSC